MTVDTDELLTEVRGLLAALIGDGWADRVTAAARLDADLRMESIELLALGSLLRERYGDAVDLPAFVATLDIDQIIELSVGDVVAYLRSALA